MRRLLEACGNVHGVPRRKPLLGPGDHFAGGNADSPLDAELRNRGLHLDGGANRSQCVVLMDGRNAEHRHNRIADELLDRAAVPLDDRLHPLEIPGEERPQRFGVEPLAELCRPGDVTEEDGDDLPLLARRPATSEVPQCGQKEKSPALSRPQLVQVAT
jgi:hypothetical protein